ncbi:uncharacterized protein VTP21DRAFT_9417 [Calcarisporiella thermophila]|uniref:uncharacterized protein n=1 Tax=Calcarisporiella thermophila TaxID=911321 RepID=UPI003743E817
MQATLLFTSHPPTSCPFASPNAFSFSGNTGKMATLLKFGFARRDISPIPSEMATQQIYQGGHGLLGYRYLSLFRTPSVRVHDPVEARAVVIRTEDTCLGLCVLDVTNVPRSVADVVRERVASATQISATNVVVVATNTHSGPDLQGLYGGVHVDYRDRIIRAASEALITAYHNVRPAHVSLGRASVLALNKATNATVEAPVVAFEVKDVNGHPLGIIVHSGVELNATEERCREISSDWAHYFRTELARLLNKDTPVLLLGGCRGLMPIAEVRGAGPFARAEAYGARMAAVVQEALSRAEMLSPKPDTPPLRVATTYFTLRIKNKTLIALWTGGYLGRDAEDDDEDYGMKVQGWQPFITAGTSATAIHLLSTTLIALPGEVYPSYASQLASETHESTCLVIGLANDCIAPLQTPDEPGGPHSLAISEEAGKEVRSRAGEVIRKVEGQWNSVL